jgi:hypothetical protein
MANVPLRDHAGGLPVRLPQWRAPRRRQAGDQPLSEICRDFAAGFMTRRPDGGQDGSSP